MRTILVKHFQVMKWNPAYRAPSRKVDLVEEEDGIHAFVGPQPMVLITLCPRSGSRIGLLGLSVAARDLLVKTRVLEGVDKFETLKTTPGNNHDGVEAPRLLPTGKNVARLWVKNFCLELAVALGRFPLVKLRLGLFLGPATKGVLVS